MVNSNKSICPAIDAQPGGSRWPECATATAGQSSAGPISIAAIKR